MDSATTFNVVKYLGTVTRTLASTTVISLLQPSGDVLSLFDDVILLAEGCGAAHCFFRHCLRIAAVQRQSNAARVAPLISFFGPCRRILYHGPVAEVVSYFTSFGFTCPPRKEVPAFLQEITGDPLGQRSLAQPELLDRYQKSAAASSRLLTVPVEDMGTTFWEATEGPGADMRTLVDADHSAERYKDVPKVACG